AGVHSGSHEFSITAQPAPPGIGFSVALREWWQWRMQTSHQGLELYLTPNIDLTVGKPADLAVTALPPANGTVYLRHAPPADVPPERPRLEALVTAGQLSRFEVAVGKVELYVNPLQPGQVFTAKYKVIPTLAGTLHAAASLIETGTTTFHVPPP